MGYKIGLELIVKCNCKTIREVPIYFADRHLAEGIVGLLRDEARRKELSEAGIRRAADFSTTQMVGRVKDLYMQVVGEHGIG